MISVRKAGSPERSQKVVVLLGMARRQRCQHRPCGQVREIDEQALRRLACPFRVSQHDAETEELTPGPRDVGLQTGAFCICRFGRGDISESEMADRTGKPHVEEKWIEGAQPLGPIECLEPAFPK